MRSQQLGYHHDHHESGKSSESDAEDEDDGDGENGGSGGGGGDGGGGGGGERGGITGPFRSSSSTRGHALFRWVDSETSLNAPLENTGDSNNNNNNNNNNNSSSSSDNFLQMGGSAEMEMDSVASGEEYLFRTAHAHVNTGSYSHMTGRLGHNSPSPQLMINSRGGSGELSIRSVSSIDGHRGATSPSLLQVIEFDDEEDDGVHAMISSSSMATLPSTNDIPPSNDVPVVAEEEVSV